MVGMSVVAILSLILLRVAWGGDCRCIMDQAVDTFLDNTFKISRIDNNQPDATKDARCLKEAEKLMEVATTLRLPNQELKQILGEVLEYETSYRKPPPGWDPDDRKANMILFHELAKIRVGLDLSLVSYGRRWCHRRIAE